MRQIINFLFETFYQVALALAIFVLVYALFLQPHQVRGHSMDPDFADGEYILTNKFSYRLSLPQRGDVIIFAAPPNRREDFIKRIIALPGETISLKNGKVFINNKEIIEKYLHDQLKTLGGQALREDSSYTLGPDEYFVLGDNRAFSSDSRSWGAIKKSDIVGPAWIVYWPPSRIRIINTALYEGL